VLFAISPGTPHARIALKIGRIRSMNAVCILMHLSQENIVIVSSFHVIVRGEPISPQTHL
jgi:hypothetical protein